MNSSHTMGEALHAASALLARSSASARLDAELLLAHVTGLPRAAFRATPERPLPASAGWSFQQLVKRRLTGEPVAYICGQQAFWTLLLEVSPAVLIPRPETELMVERALALLPAQDAVRIADLGTGSGAIALALASERPLAQVSAVDISRDALEIATRNANRLRLANICFHQGSWFAPLAGRRFALVVANPPYVAWNDPELAADVRRFEPELALMPGPSGMEALEQIIVQAPDHLAPGGWLILEHGWKQAPPVRAQLVRSGFTRVRSHADLAGHERVTAARIAD